MSAYKVDLYVKVTTVINHPSMTHVEAAKAIGTGRINTLLQAAIDAEVITDYELRNVQGQELVNYLGKTLDGAPIVRED